MHCNSYNSYYKSMYEREEILYILIKSYDVGSLDLEDVIYEVIKFKDVKISKITGLSFETIRKFNDKINWSEVSKQKLSENFIKEFKDKIIRDEKVL